LKSFTKHSTVAQQKITRKNAAMMPRKTNSGIVSLINQNLNISHVLM
jgi:hypothetical protein